MYLIEIGILCFVLGFLFGLWVKRRKTADAEAWALPGYLRYVEEYEFPDTYCDECGSNLVTFASNGRVVFCYFCNAGLLEDEA